MSNEDSLKIYFFLQKCFKWLVFLVISSLVFGYCVDKTRAQIIPNSGWSPPKNISNSSTFSNDPFIVTDNYGNTHIFWVEDIDGDPFVEGSINYPPTDTIMYVKQDSDNRWTNPIDIYYTTNEFSRVEKPKAVIDQDGTLHLVWIEGDNILYQHAPAWKSELIQEWSEPLIIKQGQITDIVLLERLQQLQIVWGMVGENDTGVYTANIISGGLENETLVWNANAGSAPNWISAITDKNDQIHIAWDIRHPQDWAAFEIRYAKSEDGQNFISRLVARSSSEDDSLAFAHPWVYSNIPNEIHLVWIQGKLPYRWHQYSLDGGTNWSGAYQIYPSLHSSTHSLAVASSADGIIYWLDILRYPDGVYEMQYYDRYWQDPSLIYLIHTQASEELGNRIAFHKMRLSILGGNKLKAVGIDEFRKEIYFMEKTLPIESIPQHSIPLEIIQPTITKPPFVTSDVNNNHTYDYNVASVDNSQVSFNNEINPGYILIISIIPVFLVLLVIIFIKLYIR